MDRAHICDRKLELPVARKTGKQILDLSDTNISQVWVTESQLGALTSNPTTVSTTKKSTTTPFILNPRTFTVSRALEILRFDDPRSGASNLAFGR